MARNAIDMSLSVHIDNEDKASCKVQNFYILLAFLLISIALLIAVSIYCHLIKC